MKKHVRYWPPREGNASKLFDCVKVDIRSTIEAVSVRIQTIIVTRTTIIMQRTFLRSFAPSKSSQLTAWPMMSPLQRTLLDARSPEKRHPLGLTPTCRATSRFEYSSRFQLPFSFSSFCNLTSNRFPFFFSRFLLSILAFFDSLSLLHRFFSFSHAWNGREPLANRTLDESLLEQT